MTKITSTELWVLHSQVTALLVALTLSTIRLSSFPATAAPQRLSLSWVPPSLLTTCMGLPKRSSDRFRPKTCCCPPWREVSLPLARGSQRSWCLHSWSTHWNSNIHQCYVPSRSGRCCRQFLLVWWSSYLFQQQLPLGNLSCTYYKLHRLYQCLLLGCRWSHYQATIPETNYWQWWDCKLCGAKWFQW